MRFQISSYRRSSSPDSPAWAARGAGVPYVMRPTGALDTWGMTNKSRLIKKTSLRLLDGPLLAGASAVHFMTDLERSRAASLRLPTKPVVLPLGFDFSAQPAQPPEPLDEPGNEGRPVILYLARIHEIKRQDGHWVVVTPKGLIVSAR